MFGTLYQPLHYEDISVGIADSKGQKIPQKHTGLLRALIMPIRDVWAESADAIRDKSKD
jgi:hypothetical protein